MSMDLENRNEEMSTIKNSMSGTEKTSLQTISSNYKFHDCKKYRKFHWNRGYMSNLFLFGHRSRGCPKFFLKDIMKLKIRNCRGETRYFFENISSIPKIEGVIFGKYKLLRNTLTFIFEKYFHLFGVWNQRVIFLNLQISIFPSRSSLHVM